MKKAVRILSIIMKVAGVLLGVAFFCWTLSDPYIEKSIFTLNEICPSKSGQIILAFVNFARNAAVFITMVAPFFYFRCTDKIVRYFTPIVVLIRFILISNILVTTLGYGKVEVSNLRILLIELQFFVEQGLMLLISVLAWVMFIFNKKQVQTKGQVAKSFGLAALVFFLNGVINIPFSFLLSLFGPSYNVAFDFTFVHRIFIYTTVLLPFITMMIFRNKTYHIRWYLCLQFALSLFFMFFRKSTFAMFTDVTLLPFHLCNTGVIIILIAFIFRLKPAFYFGLLINVLGAYFATFMPDKTGDIFYSASIHFWHNHLGDICVPFLAIGLKVFDRPKLKYVGYSLIAFTVYFLIVSFLDARFYNKGVDFFFLNSNKFTEDMKDADFIRTDFLLKFNIGGAEFQIRWLYWLIVYIGYCGLAFAMWFLYTLIYRISDSHLNLHYKVLKNRQIAKERKLMLENGWEETDMIEISHLTKIYGGSTQKAVNDFSLTVEPGEVYGFLGHNGAGKSTLIKCITGIQTITDGTIKVFGRDIKVDPKGVKRLIGYVPDNHAVYEGLTGREYVNYIADLYLVSTEERKARLEEFAEKFKISQALDKPIKDYSHGMKQKITIIAALIHNPKVWILDEPLTGLDPTSIFQVKECMKEHAKKGNIVFFSSHIIDVVERICDRIAIMKKGHIQTVVSLKELEKKKINLEDFYLETIGETEGK